MLPMRTARCVVARQKSRSATVCPVTTYAHSALRQNFSRVARAVGGGKTVRTPASVPTTDGALHIPYGVKTLLHRGQRIGWPAWSGGSRSSVSQFGHLPMLWR